MPAGARSIMRRMDPARHARLHALFFGALERPPDERSALLDEACAGDVDLRAEVDRLLAANDESGAFLEVPLLPDPADLAAEQGETSPPTLAFGAQSGAAARHRLCPRCNDSYPESQHFCPHDGEPLVEDPTALLGTTFDGLYQVEALLGRGGMGTVYRARHLLLRDTVALKLLPREVTDSPGGLRRFVREGQAARRFRHPNAVTVYDLRVSQEGNAYLVLEYVNGRTLRAELKQRGPMTCEEALGVLEPVASALEAAHRAGVVHRDLKPENVMLAAGDDGQTIVKVLDLGIAKLVQGGGSGPDTAALTRPGIVVGTPRYMSPEQWGTPMRDGVEEVDGRADVYSLGVMAYELVCGAAPFASLGAGELRQQHLSQTPRPLHERVGGVPEEFSEVVGRALAKDRGDRPAGAGQFARELRAALGAGEAASTPTALSETDWAPAASTETGEGVGSTGVAAQPTASVDARTGEQPPTNLPQSMTSFVGREREVADVCRLAGEVRLVTLVGPGGIGKTRLALQASRELLDHYPDGVWFVDLAPLADATLVVQTVATALGARERTGTSLLDALCELARAKRLLLVLDNCEHLVEACAALVGSLLRAGGGGRVLATSREALGVQGEAVWQVPPLALPAAGAAASVEGARESEAVRLFVDRARLVRSGFALTEQNADAIAVLCVRLEGIPLAIELAAARCGVLTPAQMLARLGQRLDLLASRRGDVPERHRTLRASIEWSYQLLAPAPRRLFARLSVFRGGWTLEAAETVCVEAGVLDGLGQLCECSLVVAEERGEEIRFRMLETIREYAAERLAAGEAGTLGRRHAEYYAGFAEEAEPALASADPVWLSRLAAEHDNLRAALAWGRAEECGAEVGLRLAAALWLFWHTRGYLAEGRRALEAALAHCAGGPPPLRAKAYYGAGKISTMASDFAAARTFLEEALALQRGLGNKPGVAAALDSLANLAIAVGDYGRAVELSEEGLATFRELGDTRCVARALISLGWIAQEHADYSKSTALFEEALALYRSLGQKQGIAVALAGLAATAQIEGDFERALPLSEEVLAVAREIGHSFHTANALLLMGEIARYQADYDRAAALLGESLAIYREVGAQSSVAITLLCLGSVAHARGDHGQAAALMVEGLALRAKLDGERGIAECFERLAGVAVSTGWPEHATRLLAVAERLRGALGTPLPPVARAEWEAAETAARTALGEAAFSAIRAEGQALTVEQLIRECLG
jgi:predicted ATPase/serine/threonine protein kinase